MPIYEYKCEGCGKVFEVLQRLSDPAPEKHEPCGSTEVHRVLSAAAFHFKGDGFYITDYVRKGKKDPGESGGSSSGSDSGSSSSGSGSASGSGAGTGSGPNSTGGGKTAAA